MSKESNMFANFAAMQKNSGNTMADMQQRIEESNKKADYSDDRFYYPQRDKVGNGNAVIRFLPIANGEDLPYVRAYQHNFEHNGTWFIHECLTTTGGECPVCEANTPLWKEGEGSAGRLLVRGKDGQNGRKRKLRFVANILVVKDPLTPENEGKTFLFQFGIKIQNMITAALKGDDLEGLAPINPFHMWNEGADFMLKIRKVAGQTNYDSSKFMPADYIKIGGKKLADSALETIWNSEVPLSSDYLKNLDYGGKDGVSDYDAQAERLNKVLGNVSTATSKGAASMAQDGGASDNQAVNDTSQASTNANDSTPAASGEEDAFFDNL